MGYFVSRAEMRNVSDTAGVGVHAAQMDTWLRWQKRSRNSAVTDTKGVREWNTLFQGDKGR